MALCTGLNNLNQRKSPRLDITETVSIMRPPQEILGKMQQVNKNTRNHSKLRSRKAKEDMTQQRRTQRRSVKHKRLNPAKNALSQSTLEKKMRKSLQRATKTIWVIIIPGGDQPISSV